MLLQSGDDSAFFDWPSSSSISSSSTVVSKSQSGESLSQPPRSVRSSRIHHATYLIRIGSSFTFPANRCFFGMLHVVARLAARWRRHLNATADNARRLRPTQTYAQKPILPKNVWHLFLRTHFLPSHRMFFFYTNHQSTSRVGRLVRQFRRRNTCETLIRCGNRVGPIRPLTGFFFYRVSFLFISLGQLPVSRFVIGASIPGAASGFDLKGLDFLKQNFYLILFRCFFFC